MTVTHEKSKSWVVERSRENLVGMFQQELLKIAKGEHCFTLIPRGVRKRLRKDGILEKTGSKYFVTSLGKNILGVEDSED